MITFIKSLFSPTEKMFECDDIYSRIIELENRIIKLEKENVETTNLLYELSNSINAVDVRIDILTADKWIKKNV
jgi:hypothetical protein